MFSKLFLFLAEHGVDGLAVTRDWLKRHTTRMLAESAEASGSSQPDANQSGALPGEKVFFYLTSTSINHVAAVAAINDFWLAVSEDEDHSMFCLAFSSIDSTAAGPDLRNLAVDQATCSSINLANAADMTKSSTD